MLSTSDSTRLESSSQVTLPSTAIARIELPAAHSPTKGAGAVVVPPLTAARPLKRTMLVVMLSLPSWAIKLLLATMLSTSDSTSGE